VGELNGEKLDVVMWNPDNAAFIASALSPAQILSVKLNNEVGIATVVVPDKQLSLAIGKEGQNARLAAKLTGWRIDIKSASTAEAEKVAEEKPLTEMEEAIAGEELPAETPAIMESALVSAEVAEEAGEPLPAFDTAFTPPKVPFEAQVPADKPQIRFAEDILAPRPPKPEAKSRKKKKKGTQRRESGEDDIRLRKARRVTEIPTDDEED
jgi:N utilization substance protein A